MFEDDRENTVRESENLLEKGDPYFLQLSLSFLWRTQKTHTRGRPLAPAAIINRVFHFSGLKAALSWTECDSDATNRGKTHRCISHASVEFQSKLWVAQNQIVLR